MTNIQDKTVIKWVEKSIAIKIHTFAIEHNRARHCTDTVTNAYKFKVLVIKT